MDHDDRSSLGMMPSALGNFCLCWSGLQQGGDGANLQNNDVRTLRALYLQSIGKL